MWFRRDLRVHDLPALAGAAEADRIVPVFVFDDRLLKTGRFPSANRTTFMLGCLRELDAELRDRGAQLVVRHGKPEKEIPALAAEVGADDVYFTADSSPWSRRRDQTVIDRLADRRAPRPRLARAPSPWTTRPTCAPARARPTRCSPPSTARGRARPGAPAATTPRKLSMPSAVKAGRLPSLADLGVEDEPDLAFEPGEKAARKAMSAFLREPVAATRSSTTTPPAAPRASRPTCAGAACRRWSWRRRRPRRAARVRPRSSASWRGATSTRRR